MTSSNSFQIGSRTLDIWPEGQKLAAPDAQALVMRTVFQDHESYAPALRGKILEMAADPKHAGQYGRSMGGLKLYQLPEWGLPEATFLEERAKAVFKAATGLETAAVDASWANVYRAGDYIVPHSHTRSAASLVYVLDPGDPPGEEDPMGGRFAFVDPRLDSCCPHEKGRMTNVFQPPMEPGSMLIFQSFLVHTVNPYWGESPRITMSWNINAQPLPGDPFTNQGIRRA
jgi:hypothetical protein